MISGPRVRGRVWDKTSQISVRAVFAAFSSRVFSDGCLNFRFFVFLSGDGPFFRVGGAFRGCDDLRVWPTADFSGYVTLIFAVEAHDLAGFASWPPPCCEITEKLGIFRGIRMIFSRRSSNRPSCRRLLACFKIPVKILRPFATADFTFSLQFFSGFLALGRSHSSGIFPFTSQTVRRREANFL